MYKRLIVLLFASLALLLAACGAQPAAQPAAPTAATAAPMAGMDHGSHGATTDSNLPFDAQFIDGMIVHHQGAIVMANQALKESQRPEIRQLSETIVQAQQAEITQMQGWRAAWFPNLAETKGMNMDMGPMEVAAGDAPFDQRFIEAMIPHHEGAIAMAKEAQQKAERQEIKTLASQIITAQEAEIAQMRGWLKEWFNK
ncbi:MAG: DUF305 domain-containing protein [Chloroflexaceae bacterium]|jgi:uncharacterized protein (DUF305 family)|nr:DUF305 domain-containing protein [Chloroflexaceae bacterium]